MLDKSKILLDKSKILLDKFKNLLDKTQNMLDKLQNLLDIPPSYASCLKKQPATTLNSNTPALSLFQTPKTKQQMQFTIESRSQHIPKGNLTASYQPNTDKLNTAPLQP
ncbi:hypothetical protein LLY41_00895 [Cytobacillus firmus]|uniref:hypothetical protein n=1 Tax=Cytobacillus firmus TaxID=1399 RepID=UPI002187D0CA|nr:hypothetical protein [Cytobacillus firmus]URM33091.1 hypothetical protein LLY41_00895 [Cytobacillus firmus]